MEGWPSPVDGDGLENRYGCKPIQGSNPCPSAKFVFRIPSPDSLRLTVANDSAGDLTGILAGKELA